MKKIILAATFVLGILNAPSADAAKLKIAFEDKQQFPNYMGDSATIDPVKPGIHVELVKATAAAAGVELELIRAPWKRCLEALKLGEVDAIFSASFKEDRLEYGIYPMIGGKPNSDLRLDTIAYSLYRKKGSAASWDGKTFSNINTPIGVPTGYSISDDLKKMGAAIEESSSTTLLLNKLLANRFDAVAAQDVTADELLTRPEYAGLEKVNPPLVTKDYFLLFSKQTGERDPALVQNFWAKLAKLRSEKMGELRKKYVD